MKLSSRQRQILELLLNRREEMTAGEIAEDINVSARTVHRELAELETTLAASGAALRKKSGKGIQLQAPEDKLEALRQLIVDADAADFSSEDRKLLIIGTLLQASEPLKLFALAHDLGVTVPTVSHDLDELESWIASNGLELVRRRGYGIELTGPESFIRRTIGVLVANHLDDSDLFGKRSGQRLDPVTAMLFALLGKQHLLSVEEALWQSEDHSLGELPENEYTELLIRITVAVTRMLQGKRIGEEAEEPANVPGGVVQAFTRRLSESLDTAIPDAEARYVARLLAPKNASDPHQLLTENELGYRETVQRLTAYLEKRMKVRFGDDRSLREGLLSHMESAMRRLREGAHIRNPLLAQIKRDYEPLFRVIRQAVDAALAGMDVPDEEVGFLVMHFGASMERMKHFGRSVRAVIVCTSGIGSSKMLAVRLQKELPQVEIVSHASWYEASRIPEQDYDLIISTVDLPIEQEKYIKLSPLLTGEEAEKLRAFIQDISLKKSASGTGQAADGSSSIQKLYRLQTYLNEIVRIIDQFEVYRLDVAGATLRESLLQACGRIAPYGGLKDIPAVVQLLIERQKQSSQVIPETSIALFHTRSEHIAEISFTLFRLNAELPLGDGGSSNVKHLLLMLGPRELPKETLEVLSEISSFLLNEEMISLLENGTEQEIRHYLSQELTAFFTNISKTDTRRDLR